MRISSYRRAAALSFALLVHAAAAHAVTVTFDEIPPFNNNSVVSEEYADMGVHFVSDDDGSIWVGVSGGDRGGWGLEGTNGTAFLGFNGASYSTAALFDAPVENVAIDVSRGNGSMAGDTFTLVGFLAGEAVEEVTVELSGINVWQTVTLVEIVDEIQLMGAGGAFHPYGADNLQWTMAPVADEASEEELPEVATVEIDVKPWAGWSRGWMRSWRPVFVILYGSEAFDVESVDPESLALGPDGAAASRRMFYWDVNRDGELDLISRFSARDTGIGESDEEVCLDGATVDGMVFEGCDEREARPRKRFRNHHHRRHH